MNVLHKADVRGRSIDPIAGIAHSILFEKDSDSILGSNKLVIFVKIF
jgi:hypothetical protein